MGKSKHELYEVLGEYLYELAVCQEKIKKLEQENARLKALLDDRPPNETLPSTGGVGSNANDQ
jgi:cell shape-determining protein MreC